MSKNDNRDYNGQIDYKAEETFSYQMYPSENTFTSKNEKRTNIPRKFFIFFILIIILLVIGFLGFKYFTTTSFTSKDDEVIIEAQKSYVYSTSSPNGIVKSLEFDDFSEEEIDEALDVMNIDWEKQAVDFAYEKVNLTPSKTYVTESMTDGGFTQSQIENAFKVNNFDWNSLALQYSEEYVRESFVSESRLFEKLENNDFTDEQISYVKDNMDFDFYRSAEKRAIVLKLNNEQTNENKSDEDVIDDIINELIEEGFTQDQAEQAVINLVI